MTKSGCPDHGHYDVYILHHSTTTKYLTEVCTETSLPGVQVCRVYVRGVPSAPSVPSLKVQPMEVSNQSGKMVL